MPALSIVEGTLFSTNTSHSAISLRNASRPSGDMMSQVIERLLRACDVNEAIRFHGSGPSSRRGYCGWTPIAAPRSMLSFVGAFSAPRVYGWIRFIGSTLTTSAPHSASSCATCGPAQTTVIAATRMPSSGSGSELIGPCGNGRRGSSSGSGGVRSMTTRECSPRRGDRLGGSGTDSLIRNGKPGYGSSSPCQWAIRCHQPRDSSCGSSRTSATVITAPARSPAACAPTTASILRTLDRYSSTAPSTFAPNPEPGRGPDRKDSSSSSSSRPIHCNRRGSRVPAPMMLTKPSAQG